MNFVVSLMIDLLYEMKYLTYSQGKIYNRLLIVETDITTL